MSKENSVLVNLVKGRGNLYLGKIYGMRIYVNLNLEKDIIKQVDLSDLPTSLKEQIKEAKKQIINLDLSNWLKNGNPEHLIIEKEEYLKLVKRKGSILKNRSVDNSKYLLYLLHSLTLPQLKEICKEYELRGYSTLKKNELIEFIVDSLSLEEKLEYLDEKEVEIINFQIAKALQILHKKGKEYLQAIKIVNSEAHELELEFKGKDWTTTSYLSITKENIADPERDCDCQAGANGGFCPHFWVGFFKSYQLNYFSLQEWKLTVLPKNIHKNTIKGAI